MNTQKKQKPPIYLRIWFILLLVLIGFFGILASPFTLLLWPVAIILIIMRIVWSVKQSHASSAPSEVSASPEVPALSDASVDSSEVAPTDEKKIEKQAVTISVPESATNHRRGLGDFFKATENQQLTEENNTLKNKVQELTDLLSPEHRELQSLLDTIKRKKEELDELNKSKEAEMQEMVSKKKAEMQEMVSQKELEMLEMVSREQHEVDTLQERANVLNREIVESTTRLSELKAQVIETDEVVLLQSFGLYEPRYDFATSTHYKDRLTEIRNQQKAMIKDQTAATGSTTWTVNNNKAQGRKMVKDMQKLLLRAFNTECDELIAKVKFNNIESTEKRIRASRDAISKLGAIMSVQISATYLELKLQELHLAYEYAVKKQEEKEEVKRIRDEAREQAKLEKEIEAERRRLQKEQQHCQNALERMLDQDTSTMSDDERAAYDEKKKELETQLGEIAKGIEDVDYRSANRRAGYVYVISNIGSFGENVYKIGMTRRLNPMERIDELGDASVPFRFDIHAMIFTEDAPALESALHNAFADRKVNMVNTRREFFHVTLDEIKEVVKNNFDKTVEFTETAAAQQYRESLLLQNAGHEAAAASAQ